MTLHPTTAVRANRGTDQAYGLMKAPSEGSGVGELVSTMESVKQALETMQVRRHAQQGHTLSIHERIM